MSKREAVPKHSLPPQKQILSYMGRFINCPYAPDTEAGRLFCGTCRRGEEICERGMCQLVVLLQVLAELLQTGL